MNRMFVLTLTLVIIVTAGCNSDVVSTKRLKTLTDKCIHIAPIECENPHVGIVLRDILEKEFIRRKFEMCDPNSATVFITGSTFMTLRASADAGSLRNHKSAAVNQAIDSISYGVRIINALGV